MRLKRTLEAMAVFRGVPINDLILRLLRQGAVADRETHRFLDASEEP